MRVDENWESCETHIPRWKEFLGKFKDNREVKNNRETKKLKSLVPTVTAYMDTAQFLARVT